jgi:tryptophanyl-tRNA synthetase
LLNDENHLDKILIEGSNRANIIASEKIKKIKDLIGF